jgi:hypothetical protein
VTTEVEAEAAEGHLVDMTSTEVVVGTVEEAVVVVIAVVPLALLASLRKMFNPKYLPDFLAPSSRS